MRTDLGENTSSSNIRNAVQEIQQTMKINPYRILFLSASLALVGAYIFSWMDVILDPIQRTGSDFMAFYAAGRSMFDHSPAAVYDLMYVKLHEEQILGFEIAYNEVSPFMHPPFILPLLWFVAHFNYILAFHIWAFLMLMVIILSALIATRSFREITPSNQVAIGVGVTLFFPLFISLVNGQDTAILLLGAVIWYYGLTKNANQVAGLGLALTTIRPQIALMLAIPFLFHPSRRSVWWWFCLGGAALTAVSVLIIGFDGVQNFLGILSISAAGEGFKINEIAMVNLIGSVNRFLPGLNAEIIRAVGWAAGFLCLVFLSLVWRRASDITDRHISLAIILALFASPHLHYHDLALLLIPTLAAIRTLTAGKANYVEFVYLLPLGISLVFVFTYSVLPLKYIFIYLLQIGLVIFYWATPRRATE